jgi:Ras-related protein Rab-8A
MTRRRDEEKYDYLVKLVIIGDTAVGKTNILLRYVNEEYKMSHITTIGVDFKIKTINIDGVKIKMQIWDTAGQERFKTITETYYKGAAGVVLVYSVVDRKSFNNMENWIKQINETQPESMCKIIVGNKSDCKETERQVAFSEGSALAKKYGVAFLESSAKDNYNISEIFSSIGKAIK